MVKYIFRDNKLSATPYSHASAIKRLTDIGKYDTFIRLIIFEKERLIYIRINDFSHYQGLEYKQVKYQWDKNLRACEAYLKSDYKKYRLYDSYSINELTDRLQKDILNS